MPALFFDVARVRRDGIVAAGLTRTYAQLGLTAGETLTVCARELTVESVPDRSLNLAADRLVVTSQNAFDLPDSGKRTVRIAAERIDGRLSVTCRGRKGVQGTPGANGVPTKFRMVIADPDEPQIREPRLVSLPTAGKDGRPGGPGEDGGTVRVFFATASTPPGVSAPGGDGGDGGAGGKGGAGHEDLGVPKAPNGRRGTQGARGRSGLADRRTFASAGELWARWANELAAPGVAATWVSHRLRVAEFQYRTGTRDALAAARRELEGLLKRPSSEFVAPRARVLLQQLFEHVTFSGVPRDLDVTPDVAFAAQRSGEFLAAARDLLGRAQTIVTGGDVQETIASTVTLQAGKSRNALGSADARKRHADEAVKTAVSGTDLARARARNIDDQVKGLRAQIQANHEANSGPFALMKQIVDVGSKVAGAAIGVSTGIGAFAQIGSGFAALTEIGSTSTDLFDLVGDVGKALSSSDFKPFVKSVKDVGQAGKSIYDMGALVLDLDSITASHPDPLMGKLAEAQRESILQHQQVALNTQMEKEAQLGVAAAVAEIGAINADIAAADTLAAQIRSGIAMDANAAAERILLAVRRLLDGLSADAFRTQRAREIYFAEDPVAPVRHDLGYLHPDVERILPLRERLGRVAGELDVRMPELISWSALVEELENGNGQSRTPVTLSFSSTDPVLLDSLRTSGRLGFAIPIEDLFEEDGSQLFEVKFDGVTIVLHGATIAADASGNTIDSIRLRHLGRWSVRRRDGVIKTFAMPSRHVHVACQAAVGAVVGRMTPPANPRAQPPFSLWGRGIAGDWELRDDGGLDLSGVTRVEVAFETQAISGSPLRSATRAVKRQLRPLAGGLPADPPGRPPIKVPPRGMPTYTYRYGVGVAGVAAVGASMV